MAGPMAGVAVLEQALLNFEAATRTSTQCCLACAAELDSQQARYCAACRAAHDDNDDDDDDDEEEKEEGGAEDADDATASPAAADDAAAAVDTTLSAEALYAPVGAAELQAAEWPTSNDRGLLVLDRAGKAALLGAFLARPKALSGAFLAGPPPLKATFGEIAAALARHAAASPSGATVGGSAVGDAAAEDNDATTRRAAMGAVLRYYYSTFKVRRELPSIRPRFFWS